MSKSLHDSDERRKYVADFVIATQSADHVFLHVLLNPVPCFHAVSEVAAFIQRINKPSHSHSHSPVSLQAQAQPSRDEVAPRQPWQRQCPNPLAKEVPYRLERENAVGWWLCWLL